MSMRTPGVDSLNTLVGEAWAGSPGRDFFLLLAGDAPTTTSVGQFLGRFPIGKTTVVSRFQRYELPSPKSYLVAFRLYLASVRLAQPGTSVSTAALVLHYSSPQAFGRHLRTTLGITGLEFQRRLTPETCWARIDSLLISPYADRWPSFDPMAHPLPQTKRRRTVYAAA